ncbi:hypothetical protein FE782_00965 [Paenibacillus antri]|uniref:Uncharacterized protein n=1 Tax=Paenibacillus antri TaxID=2582848 RepID=A0A5R9GDV8_9BACL|nr:hypothetical protein [Paenibacillus antri]TLS53951.1 hypothetical protein FE782_00965 [Paenibacillus antri]
MDLYSMLAGAAAVIALLVTGFGVFAAYMAFGARREAVRTALGRWTVFDYLILAVFLIGTLFLLADVAGVMKDRDAYPYYHYGYLLSGLVYNALAGVFLFVRLGMTFRLLGEREEAAEERAGTGGGEAGAAAAGAASGGAALPDDDHREPNQA